MARPNTVIFRLQTLNNKPAVSRKGRCIMSASSIHVIRLPVCLWQAVSQFLFTNYDLISSQVTVDRFLI